MQRYGWQDWVVTLLGGWLVVSPFALRTLGYESGLAAVADWNAYIVGVLVLALGIAALMARRIWEEWADLVLGAWLIISPWALVFSMDRTMTTNVIVVGALLIVVAASTIATDRTSHA
jgi:uncharacterized membrane protein